MNCEQRIRAVARANEDIMEIEALREALQNLEETGLELWASNADLERQLEAALEENETLRSIIEDAQKDLSKA